ncbi:MAG: ZIP family metal transporter [Thermoplasmata archaeon]|nr:ZIP family metal transporter [Thermoplasmata archaeon]
MLEGFIEWLSEWILEAAGGNVVVVALYASLFVALMTSLGSLVALFAKRLPERSMDFSLAFAAGIMLVASFTSLILPGMEYSNSFLPVGVGIFLGVLLIYLIDRYVPHEHIYKGFEGSKELKERLKLAWLLIFTVIIHNLPEGLAVGTSIVYDVPTGLVTAIAIGIQDFPEGVIVALPLAVISKKRLTPIALGVLSGVAEAVMGVVGALLFNSARGILPYGLGLAGGAMLYITVKEMIPEIYRKKAESTAITIGFFAGFYVMLILDSMLR